MNAAIEEKTVGELVTERPARSRVFESFGIDYCCGGKRSLREACEKKGVPLDDVAARLEEADAVGSGDNGVDAGSLALDELVDHIIATHHAYLREELPRLTFMTGKVAKVHGEEDKRLVEVRDVFERMRAELESHMTKEEMVLFPAVKRLADATSRPQFPFGSLANPINAMEYEHDEAGDALAQLRTLTDGFMPPDWACNTYRAMLDGLHELEQDLHQHIHKENNVLFPRALKVEADFG